MKSSNSDRYHNLKKHRSVDIHHNKSGSLESLLKPRIPAPDVQEQIRDYLRKDLESRLPMLKLQYSRDISHIRDHKFSRQNPHPISLPKNINELRNLVECRSRSTIDIACNKNECIDRILMDSVQNSGNTVRYLEKLDQTLPSGRKEAENLLKWFEEMKDRYENNEQFELVIIKCAEELVRQVMVECKDRGEMLKVILGYYQNIFEDKRKKIEESMYSIEQITEKKIAKLKQLHAEEVEGYKQKIDSLELSVKEIEENISRSQQEVGIYKKRFYEMQKVFLENKNQIRKYSMPELEEDSFISQDVKPAQLSSRCRSKKIHRTELTVPDKLKIEGLKNFSSQNRKKTENQPRSPYSAIGTNDINIFQFNTQTHDKNKNLLDVKINMHVKNVEVQTEIEEKSEIFDTFNKINTSKAFTIKYIGFISIFPESVVVKKVFVNKGSQTGENEDNYLQKPQRAFSSVQRVSNYKSTLSVVVKNVQKSYSYRESENISPNTSIIWKSYDDILSKRLRTNLNYSSSSGSGSDLSSEESSEKKKPKKKVIRKSVPKIALKSMKNTSETKKKLKIGLNFATERKGYSRKSILITPAHSTSSEGEMKSIEKKPNPKHMKKNSIDTGKNTKTIAKAYKETDKNDMKPQISNRLKAGARSSVKNMPSQESQEKLKVQRQSMDQLKKPLGNAVKQKTPMKLNDFAEALADHALNTSHSKNFSIFPPYEGNNGAEIKILSIGMEDKNQKNIENKKKNEDGKLATEEEKKEKKGYKIAKGESKKNVIKEDASRKEKGFEEKNTKNHEKIGRFKGRNS